MFPESYTVSPMKDWKLECLKSSDLDFKDYNYKLHFGFTTFIFSRKIKNNQA